MKKILIIGYGSIGKRHAENIKQITSNNAKIIICRLSNNKKIKNYTTVFSLKEAFNNHIDVAIVATPASTHISIAIQCVKNNIPVFIEKPISNTLQNTNKLLHISKKNNIIVMVGCNMRFHPGLIKVHSLLKQKKIGKVISIIAQVGQYLPDWRHGIPYTKTSSAQKQLGGGVILDLIHELDYLYWFFGKPKNIFCLAGKKSALKINTEDHAEILLNFQKNETAYVHLDYIQRSPDRTCKIIGEKGTIFWNYFTDTVSIFTLKNKWQNFHFNKFKKNDMYKKEIKHFLYTVKNKTTPLIDLQQGIEVLKIALAAKKSSKYEKLFKI